jgi:hypothetical protein
MIIRNRNSKKDLQYNGQKRANEQKWFQIHYTDTKGWVTRIPIKPGDESGAPEW